MLKLKFKPSKKNYHYYLESMKRIFSFEHEENTVYSISLDTVFNKVKHDSAEAQDYL